MTDLRRRDEQVGDPAVDAAWRRAAGDEPPTHVDDTILSAARAEVRAVTRTRTAPHRPSWWIRWQPLAAAAGVVGLAFVLVQLMPREEAAHVPAPVGRLEAPATDAAQTKAAAEPTAALPTTTESSATTEAQAAAAAHAPARPAAPTATAPRDAEPAPAAEEKSAASRESSVDHATQAAAVPGAGLAGAALADTALAGATPPTGARSATAPASPEAWGRRVADLHAQGDLTAAAAELGAFRQAVPDADSYLPPSLQPWAASVPAPDPP